MSAVRANIAANLAGQAWSVLLALACTPFYIGILGVEAYGLIAFFLVLQNILQLLDLGLGSALNREIARSGRTATPAFADFLATAQAWYWILGVVIAAALFAGMPSLVRWWLNPQHVPVSEVSAAARAFAFIALIQWPSSYYSIGLAGLQKQVAANAIQMPFNTVAAIGGVLLVWLGPRSVAALFLSTSPGTATISASFPASIVPVSRSTPSSMAAVDEVRSAAAADRPCSTSNVNSSALRPCGLTPLSVPKAIFTPAPTARLNADERPSSASSALAAISGGYFRVAFRPPAYSPAISVGTR